jgi:hypothetical protein
MRRRTGSGRDPDRAPVEVRWNPALWEELWAELEADRLAEGELRQQQASAVVGARQRIVEGAVGMVQLALQRLQDESVVELDEERKASMVSNLLVVLCSEQATQPVVNTGTLYQ